MLTLIDNYDSFLHNLARYIRRLGVDVVVLRNDDASLQASIERSSAVLISPGPCSPDEAGLCVELIRAFSGQIPILGVCLGHQAICQAFGGKVVRARQPMHGMTSPVLLSDSPLFAGVDSPSHFARYHSLICENNSLPACLKVTARISSTDEIMALEHITHPTYGVQFHPESVLSSDGYRILANFLAIANLIPIDRELPPNDTLHLDDNDARELRANATADPNRTTTDYYQSVGNESDWGEYPVPVARAADVPDQEA